MPTAAPALSPGVAAEGCVGVGTGSVGGFPNGVVESGGFPEDGNREKLGYDPTTVAVVLELPVLLCAPDAPDNIVLCGGWPPVEVEGSADVEPGPLTDCEVWVWVEVGEGGTEAVGVAVWEGAGIGVGIAPRLASVEHAAFPFFAESGGLFGGGRGPPPRASNWCWP